jgi:hypothetical protein
VCYNEGTKWTIEGAIMKKFVIGIIVGIAITASATAFADEIESIVGKTVQGQFPVRIDGITLDKQAAVIDGTSYLPVRAIGDAIGRVVTFDAVLGIELKKKEVGKTLETAQKSITDGMTDDQIRGSIDGFISLNVGRINMITFVSGKFQNSERKNYWENIASELQKKLEDIALSYKSQNGVPLKISYLKLRILNEERSIQENTQFIEIGSPGQAEDIERSKNGIEKTKAELEKLQAELAELQKQ